MNRNRLARFFTIGIVVAVLGGPFGSVLEGYLGWDSGTAAFGQTEGGPGSKPRRPIQEIVAESDTRPSKTITLQDAIMGAFANNLDIAIRKLDPQSAELGVTQEKAVFDPNVSSAMSYARTQEELFTGTLLDPLQESHLNGGTSAGFSALWEQALLLGSTYSVEWRSGKFYSPGTPSDLAAYNSTLAVNVTQPFLRGFGIDVNKTQIEIAKLGVSTSNENFRATVIRTLADVERAYWDLSAAIYNYQVQKESLKLAQDLLDLNRKKVEVGTLAPIQITEAEASVASRDQSVIVAGADIRAAEDNLQLIINVPPDSTEWEMALVPTDAPVFEPKPIDREAMIQLALDRRPEIAAASNSTHSADLQYRLSQNLRKPALNGVASWRTSGDNTNVSIIDANGDGIPDLSQNLRDGWFRASKSELFDTVNHDWSLGVNFAVPVGNRSAKASEARARIALEQSQMGLEALKRSITVEVRSAVLAVETAAKAVIAARSNVTLQEKKVEAEQKRYDNGMSTSFQVLTYQTDLTTARSQLITLMSAYLKSLVGLAAATGTLPEERGVKIALEAGSGSGVGSAGLSVAR